MDTLAARQQMVDQQIRTWEVLDPRVLEALARGAARGVRSRQLSRPRFRRFAAADRLRPVDARAEDPRAHLAGPRRRSIGPRARGRHRHRLSQCLPEPARRRRRIRSISMPSSPALAAANLARRAAGARAARDARRIRIRAPLGEYDVIAVTGSMPVYDARFERALRLGGRLFAVVGSAPVMDAMLVRRVDDAEWIRESLFETVDRSADQCHRCARVRVLMIEELGPREFLERRAAGEQ